VLSGKIVAKLDDGVRFTYNFTGEDTPTILQGRLESYNYDALAFLSEDVVLSNRLDPERKFTISLNTVKVERGTYTDSNGRTKSHEINNEFFLKLGALIRYAKAQCSQSNSDLGLLRDASGEFEVESHIKYTIPMGTTGKTLGTVVLYLGTIYEMHIENDNFKIDIAEDASLPDRIFDAIKNATPKGFRFNEEYLDFPVMSVSNVEHINGLYATMAEVMEAHPEKELSWLLEKDYHIVTDDTLKDIVKEFEDTDDYVYFDTETTGLDINFKSRTGEADQCVGLILSKDDGTSYFFPMQMKSIPNLCGGDHNYFMEKYMKHILETKRIVAHNASFDWKVAYIYDINTNIVDDTMAMLAVTFGVERENFPIGLKDSSNLLLHRDSLELSDLVISNKWGEGSIKFWDLPAELARYYACADTDNTRGVHRYILDNDILHKYNATRVYNIEVQFSLAVGYQEFYGHRVDVDKLPILKAEITAQIDREMEIMVDIVGHSFNPNSSPQLVKIMYEELGIPVQISRKTGRPTTDKDTLKALAERTDINGDPVYPFAVHLAKYREAEAIRKILSQYDTLATKDGYLFSSVKQYGTTTGRVSINDPNYQSYNDTVKKYICPRPGFYMFDTDYSSVEYRVLASMAGNKAIMHGFIDPDFDYHTYQASRMYGVPYAAVTKTLRKTAKGFNFGIPYGMGDESLGVRIYGTASAENTLKARALRDKYFEGQDDIRMFFDTVRDGGVSKGYTETFFGRRRYYRKSKFSVGAIRRQAGNAVIQGTAADIYKIAVGRVFARICKEGWLGKVLCIGFVHDELCGEVHKSIDPMYFLKVLREEFEVAIEGWCPLYMGFGFGMSWYEAKKTEIPIQLLWEMVEKWGTTGYPNWHQDGYELYQDVLTMLKEFEIRHCVTQLTDTEMQGKEIKPATNGSLIGLCKSNNKTYVNAIRKVISNAGLPIKYDLSYAFDKEDFLEACSGLGITVADIESDNVEKAVIDRAVRRSGVDFNIPLSELESNNDIQKILSENSDSLNKVLSNEYISGLVIKDGVVIIDLFRHFNIELDDDGNMETQRAIDLFCALHSVSRDKINVLSADISASKPEEKLSTVGDVVYSFDEDEIQSEERKQEMISQRVRSLGMYLDTETNTIILQLIPKQWMELIKGLSTEDKTGYRIRFRDLEKNTDYITEAYIPYKNITSIQNLYISYLQAISSVRQR